MQPELRAAIVQDARDGRVLMLAWMDDEAERLTRETGEAWFWSRSREELWHKGETSGNTLARPGDPRRLRRRRAARARPADRAGLPHGLASRASRPSSGAPSSSACASGRKARTSRRSPTAGVGQAAQKLVEEAGEAAISAASGDGRLVEEAADVLFHLYALLAIAGVDIAEVEDELVSRRR